MDNQNTLTWNLNPNNVHVLILVLMDNQNTFILEKNRGAMPPS